MSAYSRVSRVICFATILLCLGSALGQVGPTVMSGPVDSRLSSLPGTATDKKYILSGSVVNSLTGEGIPRALVELNGQFAAMTDPNGNFTFDGLTAGTYYVTPRKPGFFSGAEAGAGAEPVIAQVGPDSHSVTVRLAPAAVISGHVTDSDGMPVPRLEVRCLKSMVVDGRRQWQPSASANADDDGSYRLAGLVPGTYLVVAGPSHNPSIGAMAKTGQLESGFGEADFPAPEENGSSNGVRITAGQRLTADLSVEAEPFYSVSGIFNAPPGVSVWMRVVPNDSTQMDHGAAMNREGNSFQIRMLPKGDYVLQANAQVMGKNWSSSTPVHVASDLSGLMIALQPSISIPVNVDVERTQATTADFIAGGVHGPGAMPVQIILNSIHPFQQQFGASSRPNDNSAISIENVSPGTYRVKFYPNGGLYVASARSGNVDLLREDLVVTQSASQNPIEVELRDDPGKIKGTITGADHPGRVTLLVIPQNGTPYVANAMLLPDRSEFRLQQLRPGSYSILAFGDISDVEYANSDALEPYMSRAAHVDVAANQESTVTVELIKRGNE